MNNPIIPRSTRTHRGAHLAAPLPDHGSEQLGHATERATVTRGRSWAGVVAFAVLLLGVACDSESDLEANADGTVEPHCYQGEQTCDCVAEDQDATRSAAEWRKVSGCHAQEGERLSCATDLKVDGSVTWCICSVIQCATDGDRCYCERGATGEKVRACEGFEWYCEAEDQTSCHGGNGISGSGCANAEHNVTSCVESTIRLGADELPSCDGLRFAAPEPSSGGGGNGTCSGCHSDSDCHDKCLRCELSTCSCVRRLSC